MCPGYRGDDGSIKDLTLELTEYTVTLYDRRTGETLGAQGFPPIAWLNAQLG